MPLIMILTEYEEKNMPKQSYLKDTSFATATAMKTAQKSAEPDD